MFKRLKREDHDEIAFRVLLGFLLAFIPMRVYLGLEYAGFLPNPSIIIGDLHIHHFVFGITVLAIAGYASLVAPYFRRKIAWLYGIGLALAFDEFSIWLHLNDYYWTRTSITAMVLIVGLLFNGIYFKRFWLRFWYHTRYINPIYPFARKVRNYLKVARVKALAKFEERITSHIK
ncbi:hypothetical protein HY477_01365 [Candidatus Uhrbacteria bacterium]|nr:hypothetical protein [Candidatus Uhrbacteria bacterium]